MLKKTLFLTKKIIANKKIKSSKKVQAPLKLSILGGREPKTLYYYNTFFLVMHRGNINYLTPLEVALVSQYLTGELGH